MVETGRKSTLGTLFTIILLVLFIISSCGVKRQVNEMKSLEVCEFRYTGLEKATLAGVDVSTVSRIEKLGAVEAAALFAAFACGQVPLEGTVGVGVRNPGPTAAAVSGLEWMLSIDEIDVAGGRVNDRVEIAPRGGTAVVPIRFSTELTRFLSGKPAEAIIGFGMNLAGSGNQPSRIKVRVKPDLEVGGKPVQFPGYITLTREFSNGELK